ncbi:MAG: MarR family transcriptional regulator [Coriobacteriales bacterium]|nr:MarR family transcriptional regulator [Coriobacteriales bacterium]
MDTASRCLDIVVAMQERSDMPHYGHEGILEGMSLTEIHCLDRIGSLEWPNVTKVAEALRLTRGAVSKVCKKLIGRALVESFQGTGNRKEIYYRLTKDGRALFEEHQRVHEKVRVEWQSFFERYSESEQAAILRFLTDVSGPPIQTDGSEGTEKPCGKKSER